MKPVTTDLVQFDATIPLVRRNEDGTEDRHDITIRFPSLNLEYAEMAAHETAWAIVSHLPKTDDNNRHGWKIAGYGVAVEVAQ